LYTHAKLVENFNSFSMYCTRCLNKIWDVFTLQKGIDPFELLIGHLALTFKISKKIQSCFFIHSCIQNVNGCSHHHSAVQCNAIYHKYTSCSFKGRQNICICQQGNLEEQLEYMHASPHVVLRVCYHVRDSTTRIFPV